MCGGPGLFASQPLPDSGLYRTQSMLNRKGGGQEMRASLSSRWWGQGRGGREPLEMTLVPFLMHT